MSLSCALSHRPDGQRTPQLLDDRIRYALLEIDFAVDVSRATALLALRLGAARRDAEARCVQCCLDSEPAQQIQQNLDVTLGLEEVGKRHSRENGRFKINMPA